MKRPFCSTLCVLSLLFTFFSSASAQTFPVKKQRKLNIPGPRAFVYDERLSALRAKPDVKAPLIARLHRNREVGIVGTPRSTNGGPLFYPVAISRNQRGWIIAEALARPQLEPDAARLMSVLEDTKDDFARARLARLCADQYRSLEHAPRALLTLGEVAERAASKLSREAQKRIGEPDEALDKNLSAREYLLNYVGLDRYNKLGVTFDYDPAGERLVYDGGAYREILKKYPRSAVAKEAQERLAKLTSPATQAARNEDAK
ncbi:MAG: hypothetical protein U0Y68_10625 [Blastocatellia bacterium]